MPETASTEIESLRREVERLRLIAARDNGLLSAVLNHSPHGVIISDAQGRLVLHNRASERIWAGSATADNVEGWGQYRAFHPDGRPYGPDDWSMSRCLRNREVTHAEEVHFQRFDGTHGVLLGSCAPIFDEQGALTGAVSIFADITQFKRIEQEKDRWVALAGHEIRNPLSTLRTRVDLAQRSLAAGKPIDVPQLVSLFDRQVERLSTLVNDMLDVSRAQSGTLAVESARFDLGALVAQAVEPLALGAPGHRFVVHAEPGQPVAVEADRLRTEQVLMNLLGNAVRYSPDGGTITVRVRREGSAALVEVRDEGIGFAPAAGEQLFEPFFQASRSSRRTGGLGLGLYLARELVTRMGGRIAARSDGPGKGAVFSFTLPLAAT